ncbi:MAG: DUF4845 domain-containing protein [Moraxella sp.]|nr:DUF4845 domain-containing protein [Moraxella sp.]
MKQFSTLNHQNGASVTGVVLLIITLGLLARLGVGVIPAYVGDYQFTKLVAQELKKANEAKLTDKQFMSSLSQQLSINANYDAKPEEMLIITNNKPGFLAVRSQYSEESNFYGNTFIVNRFEKDITAADAK